MGIELYIIKIKDSTKDIFSQDNHEILNIIGLSTIYSCHRDITTILSNYSNIKNDNDKSLFQVYMCKSNSFENVLWEINTYDDNIKKELDEQYNFYNKSKVLEFLKNNDYEQIENLLKNRQFEEYKNLMDKFVNIIETDMSDNFDMYEYDSYKDNYNMYIRIKNISDKLKSYQDQNDIYYYMSY